MRILKHHHALRSFAVFAAVAFMTPFVIQLGHAFWHHETICKTDQSAPDLHADHAHLWFLHSQTKHQF